MTIVRLICVFMLFLLVSPLSADEETFRLLGLSQGLKGRHVLQMTQLKDGRMAIVTESDVCLYNGKAFQCIMRNKENVSPLTFYDGYTHLYIDRFNRFWIKDHECVSCLNLSTLNWEKAPKADDLFVDSKGFLWTVNGNSICRDDGLMLLPVDNLGDPLRAEDIMSGGSYHVQDIDVAQNTVYVFVADGEVLLFDALNGKETGHYRAYHPSKWTRYQFTSLVVDGADGHFYQIRTGPGGSSIFLSFDRGTKKWEQILETDYTLHTLIVAPGRKAYISCQKGYWVIDLVTGEQHLLTVLHLHSADGRRDSTLRTGYNTICRDRDGGIWLGSYDKGVLYASPEAGVFDIENGSIVPTLLYFLLFALIIVFSALWWKRHHRQVSQVTLQEHSQHTENALEVVQEPISEEDGELIQRATALVEQNLRNTEYSVNQLAADLYMERTGLYKKLTAITGLSPVAFIRSIRLERAAELLKAGGNSISEVSEMTGFSSPGYFSKCFQKQYGCLPSEYVA